MHQNSLFLSKIFPQKFSTKSTDSIVNVCTIKVLLYRLYISCVLGHLLPHIFVLLCLFVRSVEAGWFWSSCRLFNYGGSLATTPTHLSFFTVLYCIFTIFLLYCTVVYCIFYCICEGRFLSFKLDWFTVSKYNVEDLI